MGLLDRINRIWSGLDRWDKEENRRQRQQFARKDEEEERRRRAAAAARPVITRPGAAPEVGLFDPNKPLVKAQAASQSQFMQPGKDPMAFFKPDERLNKLKPDNKPPGKGERAVNSIASSFARVGVGIGQGLSGLVDLASPGKGRSRVSKSLDDEAKEIDRFVEKEGNKNLYKGGNIVGEIASFAIPSQAATKLSKAVPNVTRTLGKGTDAVASLIERGEDAGKARKIVVDGVRRGLTPDQIVADAAISSKYTGENASKGRDTSPASVASDVALGLAGGTAIPLLGDAFKILRKARNPRKSDVQDLAERGAEEAVSGATAAATNPRLLGKAARGVDQSVREEAAKIPGRTEIPQPETPTIEVAPGVKSTNLPKAQAGQVEPVDNTPAYQRRPEVAADEGAITVPKTNEELGVEAQLRKEGMTDEEMVPAFVRRAAMQSEPDIPDPATMLAPQKADDALPTPPQTDEIVADFNDAIKIPLQKAEPEVPDAPPVVQPSDADLAARAAEGDVRVSTRTDAEGNAALTSDAQVQRELEAAGIAPQRGDSPVAVTEERMANAADEVAGQQVKRSDQIKAEIRAIEDRGVFNPAANDGSGELVLTAADQRQVDELLNQLGAAYRAERGGLTTQSTPNSGVDLSSASAPRTRTRAASQISDEDLRADVLDNFPGAERLNIEQTEMTSKAALSDMSDESLVASFPDNVVVETPEDFFRAVNSIRRLETIGTPEAEVAIRNAIDGLAEFSARSGRNLRVTQVLFDDMPSTMKVSYLEKQIDKAWRASGADAPMTDDVMEELTLRITRADAATDNLRSLEDEARALLDSGAINNQSLTPETSLRINQLQEAITEAAAEKELRAGEAWRFYQEQLPKTPAGKRVGDVGRTLMLSSPAGRGFDILSTTATTADDLLTRGVSNLIGKALNKVPGVSPGSFSETISNPQQLMKGFREGASRVAGSFRGDDHVEDFIGEARRSTRGDINTGGGIVRRTVRSLVEMPTNLTRGLRNEELYRQGAQEAAQLGLKGEARNAFAELRAVVPTQEQLHQAVETHMRANMLHNNKISRFLNGIANTLDRSGGGWAAPFIRNQVAPFTSWVGGNLHRTLTDKNVLYNAASIINDARKGNMQGVVDNVSKLAVNTGEAFAVGALLTQAGILTTEDANGDSYAGLYFHLGDRYIPVAIAGTVSVPIILGNAVQQGMNADKNGEEGFAKAFVDAMAVNTLKNAGVASVFGGENNLQSTIASAVDDKGSFTDAAAQYLGDFARQYIPALSGDVNALLDYTALNPTGEAAQTKVTRENPETGRQVTDIMATELNRVKGKIPFLSQTLEREEGKPARDVIDRVLKGSHETGEQVDKREVKESLEDMESRLKKEKVPLKDDDIKGAIDDGDFDKAVKGLQFKLAKAEADPDASDSSKNKIRDEIEQAELQREGVPITKEGVKARSEEGDYDSAIRGLQYQFKTLEKDKDVPESKRKEVQDDIKRLEVTRDGNYPPAVIEMYSKTSLSEWRAMIDPESEDYDPELAGLLEQYDKQLADKGVSRSTKSGDKMKYSEKGAGSGGRGGRGGRATKVTTDIATQSFSEGGTVFKPLKASEATFAPPESAIPAIKPVPNYDKSKLKKITLSKGGRP